MSSPPTADQRGRFSLAAQSSEIRLTLLLFALSLFICGVPRVYTQTAAHTLFLEVYGAQAMPWAYVAEAVCVPLAGYLYIHAQRILAFRTLLIGTLAAQIVALVLFRLLIALKVPLVAGASIVYFEIEFVMSSLVLWGLANQLMTLRQGKRLFGFVSAGEPVAVIVCGLSTPLLLRWLSAADLFLLSALAAAVGVGLILHIVAHYRAPEDAPGRETGAELALASAQPWWRNGYVVLLAVMVAVGQMGYFFVDNAFYVEAGKRYPREAELASFLGVYSAVVGGVSLACSVLVAPWLLRRFGVRGGLLVLPGLLAVGSVAVLASAGMPGSGYLLFLLVVGNKVIDQSLRYTVDKTTFVTLFQPLPQDKRIRVQAGLESIVEPLAGGVAGAVLFVLLHALGFGAVGITAVILAVACAWIALVAVQYRGYLGSLRTALAGRSVGSARMTLDDEPSRELVRQGLESSRAGEVLYCLSLLEELEVPVTAQDITRLLLHPAREVRLELARRAEAARIAVPAAQLSQAAAAERDPEVKGALLQALAAADEDAVAEVAAHLEDPDPRVRLGAAAGLIRHGGVEGVLAVGPKLIEDLRASDAARRRFAAMLMERAGSEHFYRPLLALLRDPDPAVATAALRAASVVRAPKLWRSVLECLERPELERAAIAALAMIGEPVLPLLDAQLARRDLPRALHYALLAVYGRVGTAAADDRLAGQLDDARRSLRDRVLRLLWRRRYRCAPRQHARVRELLFLELDGAATDLDAWSRLRDTPGEQIDLVRRMLTDEVEHRIDNCFALLALLPADTDLHDAWLNYRTGGPSRRSYVIEMLDNMLDLELKRRLFPLLEGDGMDERARALGSPPAGDVRAFLCRLAADAEVSSLVRSSALYAAAVLGVERAPRIEPRDDSILAETLRWIRAGRPPLEQRDAMLTVERMLVVRSIGLFTAVRDEYLARIATAASELRPRAGERLFAQGDSGTALFVIASGRLAVIAGGKRVAEVGKRDVVGEMAALDPEPRSATVEAIEDSVLLRVASEDLDLIMSEDVEVARGIIQTLCQRLRGMLAPAGDGSARPEDNRDIERATGSNATAD